MSAIDPWPGCYGSTSREITVPLVSCGQLLGMIVIAPLHEIEITEEDLYIAQATSDVCATAIKNVQLTEELNRVANTDLLTGVHNQRYFSAAVEFELTRARRYRKPLVLAMLELAKFRQVTDAGGFSAGDEYLRHLARNLQLHIRTNDVVCRFAGDRFAFVFPETDPQQFAAIETKLLAALGAVTYDAGGEKRTLNAIVASAIFPNEGTTSAELLGLLVRRTQQDRKQVATV
jgi:diguanylate cyclase (GGDEF)-like protein